jgi:hypothetical protein
MKTTGQSAGPCQDGQSAVHREDAGEVPLGEHLPLALPQMSYSGVFLFPLPCPLMSSDLHQGKLTVPSWNTSGAVS